MFKNDKYLTNSGGHIDNFGDIQNNDTLTNTGTIDNRGTIHNAGTIDNRGTLSLYGLLVNSASFINGPNGVVLVGLGADSGAISGDIVNNGSLIFDRSDAVDYDGAISGGGTVEKQGAGVLTLSGQSGGFTGQLAIDGGTLLVNGMLGSAASTLTVGALGILGGTGTVGGDAAVLGTLSPGNSPGTLTVSGDLVLGSDATSIFELNTPGVVGGSGGAGNDLEAVGGDLTLGGKLDARVAAAGYYRLFDYGGALLDSDFDSQVVSSTDPGFAVATANVWTSTAHQVNLSVLGAGQTMQFWDGPDMVGGNGIDGGAGTWSGAGTNWTDAAGATNTNWVGSLGIFGGASGGVVTVAGTQDFDTLQFSTDGYTLGGDELAISPAVGDAGTINVNIGIAAAVNSVIIDGGGNGLTKAGAGTLTLGVANSYSGGTAIAGGVLVANNANALGSGAVQFIGDAGLRLGFDAPLTNAITGLGGVSPTISAGAHDAALTGALQYFGGSGTVLHFGAAGDTGSLLLAPSGGSWDPNGQWALDGGTLRLGNANAAGLLSGLNAATLTANTVLDLNGNALELANPSGTGTVRNDGAGPVTLSLSGTSAFAGIISDGTQSLSLGKIGGGTITLGGVNAYTGVTNIHAGMLALSGVGSIVSSSGLALTGTGRFDISQATAGTSITSLGGGAGSSVALGANTLTLTGNTGTAFAGTLSDGGLGGGTGGKLVLDGGTLVLTSSNSYSGGTTVSDGSLIAAATGALGTGPVEVDGSIGTTDLRFDGAGVSAGTLQLTNTSGGIVFENGATAGSATIDNNAAGVPRLSFLGNATAGAATITNTNSATLFDGSSSAANALVVNAPGGTTHFAGNASAGQAVIENRAGGGTLIFAGSTADGATIGSDAGGYVDISGHNSGTHVGIGSLSGDGDVLLGANTVTLGALGHDGAIGGIISEGGQAGGIGGSLVKTGAGKLVLTGSNVAGSQFTGTADINAGQLQIDGVFGDTAANAAVVNVNAGGALGGNGTIAGTVNG
ncbi:MAG TPA: autotransporter-associated beta strand repeat-containing protein, partial [Devosia sp.]|nr:autotransporter-associated beta strand repeat-containing protein [Devosia sp.]